MSVRITLPDKSIREFPKLPTGLEVAENIGPRLAKDLIAAKVNGEIQDYRFPIEDGSEVELVTVKSAESVDVIRHSAAHVMAQAVQELWPKTQVTIGPVVKNGFYYDFDSDHQFVPEDLEKIEKKMKALIASKLPVVRQDMPKKEALALFKKLGEDYKQELIRELPDSTVGVYFQGEWCDLCRGPHVQHLGQVGAVKILSLAGAYWRADEKGPQLQRIYGTAFPTEKQLQVHLKNLEEAKLRDHRKIGKDLGLFMAP